MSLLEVSDLAVGYGNSLVIDGLSFEVDAGEIVALLGTNGAGKSTLLKAISGILSPRSGRVSFDGQELAGRATHEIVAAGVVQMPGGRGTFPGLTVAENLRIGGVTVPKASRADRVGEVLAQFPILAERRDQLAGTMSGGQQQMLALARALMSRPRLLMIDELSLGLAPAVVLDLLTTIDALRAGRHRHRAGRAAGRPRARRGQPGIFPRTRCGPVQRPGGGSPGTDRSAPSRVPRRTGRMSLHSRAVQGCSVAMLPGTDGSTDPALGGHVESFLEHLSPVGRNGVLALMWTVDGVALGDRTAASPRARSRRSGAGPRTNRTTLHRARPARCVQGDRVPRRRSSPSRRRDVGQGSQCAARTTGRRPRPRHRRPLAEPIELRRRGRRLGCRRRVRRA